MLGPGTWSDDSDEDEVRPLLKGGIHEDEQRSNCWRYFMPCGWTAEGALFGTNLRGLNLFGVFAWGPVVTFVMELQYMLLSECFKEPTLRVGVSRYRRFLKFHYHHTWIVFFLVYIILVLVAYVCRSPASVASEDGNRTRQWSGTFASFVLLSCAALPAGIAGAVWEADKMLVVPEGSEKRIESQVHSGWLVLVITPLLWPIVCSCYLVLWAATGNIALAFWGRSGRSRTPNA